MINNFLKRFSDWKCLQTGGYGMVLVKDIKDLNGTVHAVGVSDECIVVYRYPYNEKWNFFESEEIMVVPLCNSLIDRVWVYNKLYKLFSQEQVKEMKSVAEIWQNF